MILCILMSVSAPMVTVSAANNRFRVTNQPSTTSEPVQDEITTGETTTQEGDDDLPPPPDPPSNVDETTTVEAETTTDESSTNEESTNEESTTLETSEEQTTEEIVTETESTTFEETTQKIREGRRRIFSNTRNDKDLDAHREKAQAIQHLKRELQMLLRDLSYVYIHSPKTPHRYLYMVVFQEVIAIDRVITNLLFE